MSIPIESSQRNDEQSGIGQQRIEQNDIEWYGLEQQRVDEPLNEPASPVDDGLRSLQGIRWLLLAGSLVVAVSVVRLVAAEWGGLGSCARFLTLVVGALTVFGIGDLTRNRLRLPVAGSAFLCLFAAMVPLLAWGASHLQILETPAGWPSLILGLGGLLAASQRVLRDVLGYRGWFYTATLGGLLMALPALPYLEARWTGQPELFFVLTIAVLGVLLWAACRHINRFFFHRDRLQGIDRPIHGLPFALLVLVYAAAASQLVAFWTHLALPLACIALALLDAGEEYFRALIRATGQRPERWPRRSVALLALGFATLATALVVSPLDPGSYSLALVSSIVTWRLLAWAIRYRSAMAHGCGLLAGIIAYHAVPVLYPDTVVRFFKSVVETLGFDPNSPAAIVGLGDLWMIGALLALAWVLRDRLTPGMAKTHTVITAFAAGLLLLLSLFDPMVARWVAPICAAFLLGGIVRLSWPLLLPVFYQALVTTAFAWTWPGSDAVGGAWLTHYGLVLALVQALFLGGGLWLLRRRPEVFAGDGTLRLLTWPPLGMALWLVAQSLDLSAGQLGSSGTLMLVAAESFLLAGCILRHRWLFGAAAVGLTAGLHCVVGGATDGSTASLSLVSQGLMVVAWVSLRQLAQRRGQWVDTARYGLRLALVACAASGLFWIAGAAAGGDLTIEPLHLLLIGSLLCLDEVDRDRRRQRRLTTDEGFGAAAVRTLPWRLQAALGALFLWVPLQAASFSIGGLWFAGLGWLGMAFGLWIGGEALARRGGSDLPRMLFDAAMLFGASGGISAIWDGAIASTASGFVGSSPWVALLPGFLASLFFVFMATHGHHRKASALWAAGTFLVSFTALLFRLATPGPELYCLGPGLAFLGLSQLLHRELGDVWRDRLFTLGAASLYAMPVLGLLDQLSWGWQIALLLLAVGFGAASFRLRSRSLLTVSTAALVIDLACFLIRLRQTEPLLLWVAGVAFGLGLMAVAGLLEHRREVLLQHLRVWGQELRSWA